ncbi:infB, partial [Ophiophagus hannah]
MLVVWEEAASPCAKKSRAPSSPAAEPGQREHQAPAASNYAQTLLCSQLIGASETGPLLPDPWQGKARQGKARQGKAQRPKPLIPPSAFGHQGQKEHPAARGQTTEPYCSPSSAPLELAGGAYPVLFPPQQVAPRRDGSRDDANATALGAPALGPWRGGQEELEAAWTAAATRRGGPRAKRSGWAAGGELPVGLYRCGGEHGQFHGSDQEPGAVAVPLFRAESAPGAETSLASEQLGHLQRRQSRGVSVDAKLAAPRLFLFHSIAHLPGSYA